MKNTTRYLGLDVHGEMIAAAVCEGRGKARSLGQFLVYCALGILAAAGLIEFGIRKVLISRQRRRASGVCK